jgi:hypothetical protein
LAVQIIDYTLSTVSQGAVKTMPANGCTSPTISPKASISLAEKTVILTLPPQNVSLSKLFKWRKGHEDDEGNAWSLHA